MTKTQERPTHDRLAHLDDAAFMLNPSAEIVDYNAAAQRLFGLHHQDVLGHRCYDLFACQDHLGHGRGAETCPLLLAVRTGQPLATADSIVLTRQSSALEVTETVTVLPDHTGSHALLLVRPSPSGVVDAPRRLASPSTAKLGSPAAQDPRPDLDLAGILDRLLVATGADAAELFLVSPTDQRLLLTANRGRAARAFRQIGRFEVGQGYPGLVAQLQVPLSTDDLSHDSRYLRTEVSRRGFHSYLCVPIYNDSGSFIGTLNIASCRRTTDLTAQLPFMVRVAHHLGAALELVRLRLAERIAMRPDSGTNRLGSNLSQVAGRALDSLMDAAGVDSGALLLADATTKALQLVKERKIPPALHHLFPCGRESAACPAIAWQSPSLAVDRQGSHLLPCCHALARHLPTAICVPITLGAEPFGVAVLGTRHHEPLPAQHLGLLHTTLEHVSLELHTARAAFQREQGAWEHPGSVAPPATESKPFSAAIPSGTAAVPPFLEIQCLGKFVLAQNGLPIQLSRFARRRSLVLLKILLTRYGKPVHREELIDLLWPEGDLQSAGTLLKVAIHYLRRGLAPFAPAGQHSPFIITDGDNYLFNTQSPHRLDSQEFLKSADLAAQLEAGGHDEEALAAYRRAGDWYAGDYLEEERYSDWCALEREYLRERFLTVLRHTAQLNVYQGNVEAAVLAYRRALQTDHTLEDIHRGLMDALWRAGRRNEALRQYSECRSLLERELGTTPMPQTETLRRLIAQDRGQPPAVRTHGVVYEKSPDFAEPARNHGTS